MLFQSSFSGGTSETPAVLPCFILANRFDPQPRTKDEDEEKLITVIRETPITANFFQTRDDRQLLPSTLTTDNFLLL
jgi:hypothetical protein